MANIVGTIVLVCVVIFANCYGIADIAHRIYEKKNGFRSEDSFFWSDLLIQIIGIIAVDMIVIAKWRGVW